MPERSAIAFGRKWMLLEPRIGREIAEATTLKTHILCGRCNDSKTQLTAERFLKAYGERFDVCGTAPYATLRLIRQCARPERPLDTVRFGAEAAAEDEKLWEELFDSCGPKDEARYERLKAIRERLRSGKEVL
jgi:hypothetical protein